MINQSPRVSPPAVGRLDRDRVSLIAKRYMACYGLVAVQIGWTLLCGGDLAFAEEWPVVQSSWARAGVGHPKEQPTAGGLAATPLQSSPLTPPDPQHLWRGGWIRHSDPLEYPRIASLDYDRPDSVWDTYRPNLVGEAVTDEWDFTNIINSDRPDFTDATYSVGRGVVLVETGYTYRSASQGGVKEINETYPETLVRLGVTNEFELRIRWNGVQTAELSETGVFSPYRIAGGDDLNLGFKWEMWQQDGWLPMGTLVAGATVPAGSADFSSNTVVPYWNFVYGWYFRRWLYLKGSIGIDWHNSPGYTLVNTGGVPPGVDVNVSRDRHCLFHNSVSLLVQYSRRHGGFVEWFQLESTGQADDRAAHYADIGHFFYLTSNVQLDVRIGTRLSNRVDEMFAGGGFAFRY